MMVGKMATTQYVYTYGNQTVTYKALRVREYMESGKVIEKVNAQRIAETPCR